MNAETLNNTTTGPMRSVDRVISKSSKASQELLPLVISIDWDFFVEEDPNLDLGHMESGPFLNEMWAVRESNWRVEGKNIEEVIPFRGPTPLDFAGDIGSKFRFPKRRFPLAASAESHAMIPSLIGALGLHQVDIVNFDAHHDLGYDQESRQRGSKFACDNWALRLLQDGVVQNYTLVYPDWRQGDLAELTAEAQTQLLRDLGSIGNRCKIVRWSEFEGQPERPVQGVFLCRSGCWVPPCYDRKFNQLCAVFGVTGFPTREVARTENRVAGVLSS